MKKETLIVGFANQKGGAGKSTLTHLTAKTLGHESRGVNRKNILVLEVDKQASLLNVRKKWEEKNPDYKYPYDLINCELVDLNKHISEVKNYDLIFIDMPGTIDKDGILTTLTLADILFIPIQPSILDIDATVTFIEKVFVIKNKRETVYNMPFEYYTIINRLKVGTKAGKELVGNLEDSKINMFETTVKDYSAYNEHIGNYDYILENKEKYRYNFENFIEEFESKINEFISKNFN